MVSLDFRCSPEAPRNSKRIPELAAPAAQDSRGGLTADSATSTQPCGGMRLVEASEPPRKWGHLARLRKIGQGFFGEVYRAWDTLLEREVALKLYRESRQALDEWARFGLQEARSLARVRHPNVVTVYGVDYRKRRLGVWMEYIQGRTLEALLRDEGPLAAPAAARIGFDLCDAVAAVHSRGILHRDIQSKNVMRGDCGRIVLMDFGLSQDLRPLRMDSVPRVCGTPLYMAPEILRGEAASVQSDIYSIGVLLYRLVTGRFPVKADTLKEVQLKYARGEFVPLRERRPDLPEAYLHAVERALARNRKDRFATAEETGEALRASFGTAGAN